MCMRAHDSRVAFANEPQMQQSLIRLLCSVS